MVHDKPEGLYQQFDEYGNLAVERTFSDGKVLFVKEFRTNGNLLAEGRSSRDFKHGKWIWYKEDGSVDYWKEFYEGNLIGENLEDYTWEIDQKNDMELETVAVLTTRGNKQMQEIHNNPEMLKRKNSTTSRMPVIVPREMWDAWLNPNSIADPVDQEKLIQEVCVPYPDELLESYTTYPLNKGRDLVNPHYS